MKLYTRPRPTVAILLRTGDQVATTEHGELVVSEGEYVDLDLREDGSLTWSAVHAAHDTPDAPGDVTVVHSHGTVQVFGVSSCVMREVIELDPWSYVKH